MSPRHPRSWRLPLAAILVMCLTMAFGAATVSASPRATAARPSSGMHFVSSGHQTSAVAHPVNTATAPIVKASARGTMPARPAPAGLYPNVHGGSPAHVDPAPAAPKGSNLSVKTSFDGQSENGWQPSDSNGFPGFRDYVEVVNEQWAIYTRSGGLEYSSSFQGWLGLSGSLFDPKVVFDNKRWFMLVDDGSALHLSVSQQARPLGNWCNYTFPGISGDFADYPQLGVNADGVYMTVNEYGNTFSNRLFFANRAQLVNCQTVNYTFYDGITNPDTSVAFAVVPAVERVTTSGLEYMVNSFPGGACQVTIWYLYSNGSLFNANLNTQCYAPPPAGRQSGSAGLIDTGDNRMYQADYVNGELVFDTVGSHDWGDGNGQVGIVEWFRVNPATPAINSQGAFGTVGYWLFYPAMEETGQGRIAFVYNATGPSIFPSIWAISKCLCDTIAVANGVSYYGTSGTARWGDYQSAWLDPKLNLSNTTYAIYVTGQYANATNTWGTHVMRIVPHS